MRKKKKNKSLNEDPFNCFVDETSLVTGNSFGITISLQNAHHIKRIITFICIHRSFREHILISSIYYVYPE